MSYRFLLALVAAGGLIALPVAAQPATPGMDASAVKAAKVHHGRGHRVAMMDTDRDGKVSWTEFSARMKAAFDKLDTNHDGYLDPSEMPKGGRGAKGGGLNDKSFGDGTWGKPSPNDNPPPFVSDPPAH